MLVVAFQAVAVASLDPIRSVPVVTSLTMNAFTVLSMSASFPSASKFAKDIAIAESSLPVATGPENWVSVGGSLTAPTETRKVLIVSEYNAPSKAFTVKASIVPLTVAGGVQTRVSPGAIEVAPTVTGVPFLVSVPPSTDSIRKESGSPFGSESSSAAASVAYVNVKGVSSEAPETTAGFVVAKLGA